jgi:hypothetical protein
MTTTLSRSQQKKQAQAAAAAGDRGQPEDDQAMPQMPHMPDPNIKLLWSADTERKEFDFSKFIQIWPAYIDSKHTIEEGRRVGKEFCCKFILFYYTLYFTLLCLESIFYVSVSLSVSSTHYRYLFYHVLIIIDYISTTI